MSKKMILIAFLLSMISSSNAYMINGMYASLISCDYGNSGYDYGYIGTYKGSDDKIYRIFFGSNYCEY